MINIGHKVQLYCACVLTPNTMIEINLNWICFVLKLIKQWNTKDSNLLLVLLNSKCQNVDTFKYAHIAEMLMYDLATIQNYGSFRLWTFYFAFTLYALLLWVYWGSCYLKCTHGGRKTGGEAAQAGQQEQEAAGVDLHPPDQHPWRPGTEGAGTSVPLNKVQWTSRFQSRECGQEWET